MEALPRHQCVIYEGSPARHIGHIASILISKLQASNRCLYLNSPSMVAGIRSYLAAAGLDVAAEVKKGALVLSSDNSHLTNGLFDTRRMIQLLSEAVDLALHDGYQGLWATGDMTWEFGSEKNLAKLLEYEYALEDLFASQPAISGVCQYHKQILPAETLRNALHTHPSVYLNQTLARINPYYRSPQSSIDPHADTRVPEMLNQLRLAATALG